MFALLLSLALTSSLDRTTPANAATSCTKALAKKSAEHAACWDWPTHYVLFRKAMDNAKARAPDGGDRKARVTFDGWLTTGAGTESAWLAEYKPLAMSWIVEREPSAFGRHADRFFSYLADGTRGGAPAKATSAEQVPVGDAALEQKNDLKVGVFDHVAFMDAFATLRVDEVFHINPDRAWIASRGKNADGSTFRVATLWRRVDKQWAETIWGEDDLAQLPQRFPKPQSFHVLPRAIVTVFAREVLPTWLTTADPAGVVVTTNWEARWPRPVPPPVVAPPSPPSPQSPPPPPSPPSPPSK